jgi:hypothetical protein
MAKIEDEFRDAGIVRGMTLILQPSDAIAFVRRCRERQVKVLGLDAFHITPETRQPDMGESIDLSLPPHRGEDCWQLAEEFLNERLNSGLYFEVVADE